jgi:phytanoyl-CoA hydroxylase
MITPAQREAYEQAGAIVVDGVLSQDELAELRSEIARLVELSRGVTSHDDLFDLEDTHSPTQPRLRRIKLPHLHSTAFARIVDHPGIVAVLRALLGPNVRFDLAKLNMKSAAFGAAVEWHQDWAFYPHTNDDLAAVGVMIDDMALSNGPLMVIPGSHKGPVFDHHENGRFCGAMDPAKAEVDYGSAVPLTGPAGSISVHHVRLVHGSAVNTSRRDRRLLLLQYRAADAWPLLTPPVSLESYDMLMVAGEPREPRLAAVPVRLPLPPADLQGSIYENQKARANRYF